MDTLKIATEAVRLHRAAQECRERYPEVAKELKERARVKLRELAAPGVEIIRQRVSNACSVLLAVAEGGTPISEDALAHSTPEFAALHNQIVALQKRPRARKTTAQPAEASDV